MFVSERKHPPAVRLSFRVRVALGKNVEDLYIMPLLPAYNRKIKWKMFAFNILRERGQLLPEEYDDFMTYQFDNNAMIRLLRKLCSDITISSSSRRFISLVVASCNMHVFDVPEYMSMKDVFFFV